MYFLKDDHSLGIMRLFLSFFYAIDKRVVFPTVD